MENDSMLMKIFDESSAVIEKVSTQAGAAKLANLMCLNDIAGITVLCVIKWLNGSISSICGIRLGNA
jgi:hypothetical protein